MTGLNESHILTSTLPVPAKPALNRFTRLFNQSFRFQLFLHFMPRHFRAGIARKSRTILHNPKFTITPQLLAREVRSAQIHPLQPRTLR
jgi:hypothetical protein